MSVYAIICEYNPFHSGHKYQIDTIKKSDPEARIVCIMSGNFVQRGDVSIMDKYRRASFAVRAGADLVLELPFPWSAAPAEVFARGAVDIAEALGFVDVLHFGSETGDAGAILRVAANMQSPEFEGCVAKMRKARPSLRHAELLRRAYAELFGNGDDGVFCGSNNILALEYVKRLLFTRSNIRTASVKREGNSYGDLTIGDGYCSATAIRHAMLDGRFDADGLFDYSNEELYSLSRLSDAILAFFRLHSPAEISTAFCMNADRAARIASAAREAISAEELVRRAVTKTDSEAAVRRAMLFAMLGIRPEHAAQSPCFSTLLAANDRGTALLRSRKIGIEIVTKPADYRSLSQKARAQFERSLRAEGLFALAAKEKKTAYSCLKKSPYIHRD